jgi:hypothetical protein
MTGEPSSWIGVTWSAANLPCQGKQLLTFVALLTLQLSQ